MKLNGNVPPFPPNKYVGWLCDAYDGYKHSHDEEEMMGFVEEIQSLYDTQTAKIAEEMEEVFDAGNSMVVSMTDEEYRDLLCEYGDLLQATMQGMYMICAISGISYDNIIATTMLKCLTRDKNFYDTGKE